MSDRYVSPGSSCELHGCMHLHQSEHFLSRGFHFRQRNKAECSTCDLRARKNTFPRSIERPDSLALASLCSVQGPVRRGAAFCRVCSKFVPSRLRLEVLRTAGQKALHEATWRCAGGHGDGIWKVPGPKGPTGVRIDVPLENDGRTCINAAPTSATVEDDTYLPPK